MVVAGSFFHKRDSHKVTYSSGNHETELDLLVVRRQQLCRIKYCKAISGEYVTTQHKPVVFMVGPYACKSRGKVGCRGKRRSSGVNVQRK